MDLTQSPLPKKRLALMDFNDGQPNRGTGAIQKLALENGYDVVLFDVRKKELPDINDHDVFVCTGGPGDPNDWGQHTGNAEDNWGQGVFDTFDAILDHNAFHADQPKYLATICHSFQLFCHHKKLGELGKRENGTLVGIHTHNITPFAHLAKASAFDNVSDIVHSFESRDYRVKPIYCSNGKSDYIPVTMDGNGHLTSIAKRDGTVIGTQFHFEATAEQVGPMLDEGPACDRIIAAHGPEALEEMRACVPQLTATNNILRRFLEQPSKSQKLGLAA